MIDFDTPEEGSVWAQAMASAITYAAALRGKIDSQVLHDDVYTIADDAVVAFRKRDATRRQRNESR